MLKSQARTAGVSTYWTTVRSSELAHEDGTLTRDGEALAKQFPLPVLTESDLERLASPRTASHVRLSLEDLYVWSDRCHLGAARAHEKQILASALRVPDRRNAIARALRECERHDGSLPEQWDVPAMRKLRSRLTDDGTARGLDLPVVIDAIIAFEQLHEAVLVVFDTLMRWGTEKSHLSSVKLITDSGFRKALPPVRERAQALLDFSGSCCETVGKAIKDFVEFAYGLARTKEAGILDEVLRRHRLVQSGKLDGGTPKREWITYEPGGKVIPPAARFRRRDRPTQARGRILTHPYRVERFVGMLGETGELAARSLKANSNG